MAFYSLGSQGSLELIRDHANLTARWDGFLSGRFFEDNLDVLLGYNQKDNASQFFATDGEGGFNPSFTAPKWTKICDLMTPADFNQDGFTDVLCYNRLEGHAEVYISNKRGQIDFFKVIQQLEPVLGYHPGE